MKIFFLLCMVILFGMACENILPEPEPQEMLKKAKVKDKDNSVKVNIYDFDANPIILVKTSIADIKTQLDNTKYEPYSPLGIYKFTYKTADKSYIADVFVTYFDGTYLLGTVCIPAGGPHKKILFLKANIGSEPYFWSGEIRNMDLIGEKDPDAVDISGTILETGGFSKLYSTPPWLTPAEIVYLPLRP